MVSDLESIVLSVVAVGVACGTFGDRDFFGIICDIAIGAQFCVGGLGGAAREIVWILGGSKVRKLRKVCIVTNRWSPARRGTKDWSSSFDSRQSEYRR